MSSVVQKSATMIGSGASQHNAFGTLRNRNFVDSIILSMEQPSRTVYRYRSKRAVSRMDRQTMSKMNRGPWTELRTPYISSIDRNEALPGHWSFVCTQTRVWRHSRQWRTHMYADFSEVDSREISMFRASREYLTHKVSQPRSMLGRTMTDWACLGAHHRRQGMRTPIHTIKATTVTATTTNNSTTTASWPALTTAGGAGVHPRTTQVIA